MDAIDPIEPSPSAAPLAGATALARSLTGMELAYVSRFSHGEQLYLEVSGATDVIPLEAGMRAPLESTMCQRMVDGRLPHVLPDSRTSPEADRLMAPAGVRAYIGVPLRAADGALLGTLCALSRAPRPELGSDALTGLEALAPLVASQLVLDAAQERQARRAAALVDALRREVRAPAMAIRFLAEDLAAGSVEPDRAGTTIAEEVAGMLERFELALARDAAPASGAPRAEVDLTTLCSAAVARLSPAPGRVRMVRPEEPVRACVDPALVGHAIGTLVDGALQRRHEEPVVVELRVDGPTALVLVHDDGRAGAVPADAAGRADAALEAGIRGLGYGLAAVQAVASAHEGTLRVVDRPGGGATAALRLPRAAPAAREAA